MSDSPLPYGIHDLDPVVVRHPDDPDRIRCYVRGCRHFLRRPRRRQPGELCPDHGIYCHYSSYGATYSYADVRRNIIASPDLFAKRIVGHPFKYESHRLGLENSEDALSWNVFRSLQEAGCLAQVAKLLVGEDHPEEPDLYLWGIRVSDDSFEPWDLLIAARERFESNLPVERPLTEPDIALHLPGKYLVLIEAKFTSQNPYYESGPRKDSQSLTLDELLEIYWDPSLRILDYSKACAADRIHYRLWRNMVLAEWMAGRDSRDTIPYHVNLVRQSHGDSDVLAFRPLTSSGRQDHIGVAYWEQVNQLPSFRSAIFTRLLSYLARKTASLRPALFDARVESFVPYRYTFVDYGANNGRIF
jgi:hypothetical protein